MKPTGSFGRQALSALQAAMQPPKPIRGAEALQLLRPSRRAHLWHWAKWAGAQLSALAGLILVLSAFDLTEWLPRNLQFIRFLTQWDDYSDYLPPEWQWVGLTLTLGGFLTQFGLTLITVWLEWRTIAYLVTDQGVQLRHGLWTVNETSLRFANIQQVVFKQGLIQRVLRLADVVVSTAGQRASGDDEDEQRRKRGLLRDLDAAQARSLIDAIRERLPLASGAPPEPAPTTPGPTATLAAAQQLLGEAQALRAAVQTPRAAVQTPRAAIGTLPFDQTGQAVAAMSRRVKIARRTPRTLGGKAWNRGRRRAR